MEKEKRSFVSGEGLDEGKLDGRSCAQHSGIFLGRNWVFRT